MVTQQVIALKFPRLNVEQEGKVRNFLDQYASVFVEGNGDLGFTDLIEHQIPDPDDLTSGGWVWY